MTPATDHLDGQVIADRYRLHQRLGAGGMSVVYLAERTSGGDPLAIKFLRSAFVNLPGFVRRFEQEAHACRRLENPHCVRVLDFGMALGNPFLALEYVDGRPLTELLAGGALEPRRTIGIVQQVLEGLAHAHGRGVVHRDLKPGNVMLIARPEGELVKIMDFGTAQILTGEPASTSAGTEVGTPWYMAPEQAAGQDTDHRTDLYAVGVMMFEMLTGERPFVADDPMRVLQMHLHNPVPALRVLRPALGLSAEVEEVLMCALQKRPPDRFESADAFASALADVPEVNPAMRKRSPPRPRKPTEDSYIGPPPASTVLARAAEARRPRGLLLPALIAVAAIGALFVALWLIGII